MNTPYSEELSKDLNWRKIQKKMDTWMVRWEGYLYLPTENEQKDMQDREQFIIKPISEVIGAVEDSRRMYG